MLQVEILQNIDVWCVVNLTAKRFEKNDYVSKIISTINISTNVFHMSLILYKLAYTFTFQAWINVQTHFQDSVFQNDLP